jgi:hypothetical protein
MARILEQAVNREIRHKSEALRELHTEIQSLASDVSERLSRHESAFRDMARLRAMFKKQAEHAAEFADTLHRA